MRNPIDVLNTLSDKSKDPLYRFERLYRNLYNPEFYLLAYKNIYANEGSMTPGVNNITMDGMSNQRIQRLIESLKDHSYRPYPARRTYIRKNNSKKKRPLGIPSGDDKLVQEIVRMILESTYEPTFSDASHGFRSHRSCHTALKKVQSTFTGAVWFIEGDIKACFDSFDHHVLIEILRKRINDESFISLMWKFLKAGYMEQWEYHKTYTGTPQGSGVSPILANIYLNELDSYMMEYTAGFKVSNSLQRKQNAEYERARSKARKFEKEQAGTWQSLSDEERKERAAILRKMKADVRQWPSFIIKDEGYKRLQYVRYADDFIIGVIGSKADSGRIKEDLSEYIENQLHLTLSAEKTLITHTAKRARFLGYDVTVSRSQETRRNKNGVKQRAYRGSVKLYVPHEKWASKLKACGAIRIKKDESGKERWQVMHRGKLTNDTDIEILQKFNSEVRGLYNFYSMANNAHVIGKFSSVMKSSLLKTFAAKYRTTSAKIKQRYVKGKDFTVPYTTKAGSKESTYYNKGFKRQNKPMYGQVDMLDIYKKYDRPNSLTMKLRTKVCELCGSKCDDVEIHQVKRLKDLTGQSEWELVMKQRRRKTLAVCPACHSEIHKNDKVAS